jgi:hypothetical protein
MHEYQRSFNQSGLAFTQDVGIASRSRGVCDAPMHGPSSLPPPPIEACAPIHLVHRVPGVGFARAGDDTGYGVHWGKSKSTCGNDDGVSRPPRPHDSPDISRRGAACMRACTHARRHRRRRRPRIITQPPSPYYSIHPSIHPHIPASIPSPRCRRRRLVGHMTGAHRTMAPPPQPPP